MPVTQTRQVITVRLARADEGPVVASLMVQAGYPPYPFVSWEESISPFWVMAVDEQDTALACVQVRISKPMATIEAMCLPLQHRKRLRIQLIRTLAYESFKICASYGVQAVQFGVNTQIGEWERIVQRYGAIKLHDYPTYVVKV